MAEVDPPHFAAWIFDIEADYRAARAFDPPIATVEALADKPGAVEGVLAAASARHDLAGVLAAGAVLRREGRLTSAADRLLYASALTVEGRFTEAVRLYREVVAEAPDDAVTAASLAEVSGPAAEFGLGRGAAHRSNTLKPKLSVANLARRLKWIDKLWRNREGLSWAEAAQLIDGLHIVEAAGPAVVALKGYVSRPPEGEPTAEEVRRLAEMALMLGLPTVAKRFMARLTDADDPALRPLKIERSGRLGESGKAAYLADVSLALADSESGGRGRALRLAAAAAYSADGRAVDAVRELDALVCENDRDFVSLVALQRAVGQYVLGGLDAPWAAPRPPKIINLLPFYQEQMLLDLRVDEMGEWVDHFVISEAAETFTGRSKPLYFAETKARFAARGDQMLSVGVEAFPDFMRSAWTREFYQRDMAVAALAGVWRPDDIILITDADEIVDRTAFAAGWPDLANLRMATSQMFFNYVANPDTRHGNRRSGAVCRASALARFGSSYIRTGLSAARKSWESHPNAGWHFTSLTDAEGVAAKFTDFSHQEASKATLRDVDGAGAVLAAIRAGRYQEGWSRRPIDARLPRYVRENQARLAALILTE